MRIAVGLFPGSPAWDSICRQEGVPFDTIAGAADIAGRHWSAIVVTRKPDPDGVSALSSYLQAGGGLLGFAGHLGESMGWKVSRERISYLVADGNPFGDVEVTDLDLEGVLPSGASALRTDTGRFAVTVEPRGGGHVVLLPFDPAQVQPDTRTAYRAFYAADDRLPTERVSAVAKGEAMHIVHRALEHLHHVSGSPYAHLSWFPSGAGTVFGFRIDTDSGGRADIAELAARAREYRLGFSWFLDVGSHASWLNDFASMEGQEHGVHCFDHRMHRQEADLRIDLTRARRSMIDAGLNPRGAAATFGHWSPAYERIIADLGFEYSSEFSLGYDTLPFRPDGGAMLQVPIHPICIGSLLRVGYTRAQMTAYFDRVVARKRLRGEPIFLYHHPLHRSDAVVDHLLAYARTSGVMPMTLGDYARWWRERERVRWTCDVAPRAIHADLQGSPANIRVCVTVPSGGEYSVPPGSADLSTLPLQHRPAHLPPPDMMRVREPDPRARVAQLYDMILRRFR